MLIDKRQQYVIEQVPKKSADNEEDGDNVPKNTRYLIHKQYVTELGCLILPFFHITAQLGTTSSQPLVPRENDSSETFPEVSLVSEQDHAVMYRGSKIDIPTAKTDLHMATATFHLPMSILTLFVNLAAINTNQRALPCYMTQPDVNNRIVTKTDIYDEKLVGKANRQSKEWGTLETAWGTAPQTLNAAKAVIFLYEVHAKGVHEDEVFDPAKLQPCLSTISKATALVGYPVARRLTLPSASSLFAAITGKDPAVLFHTQFLGVRNEPELEDQLAHRLVCSALVHMRTRYHGLKKSKDWEELYCHLWSLFSKKFLAKRTSPENETYTDAEMTIFKALPRMPKTDVEVRKGVRHMVNAISPVRLAFLDGQRRAGGVMYALMNRLPENSLEELAESLRPETRTGKLVATHTPDYARLSSWVAVDSVRAKVEDDSVGDRTILGAIEVNILKRHSEVLQQDLTSNRERTSQDTLTGVLSSLEMDSDFAHRYLVMGELQTRKKTQKSEDEEDDWIKNSQVYGSLRDYVLRMLYSDTTKSMQLLVANAKRGMGKPFMDAPESEKLNVFLETNTATLDSEKITTLNFVKDKPRTRKDLNSIAVLCANYVSSKQTLNRLVNLVTLEYGHLAYQLSDGPDGNNGTKNMKNQFIGYPGENGKLYGVSTWSFVLPQFFLVGKRDKLVSFSAVRSFVLPQFFLVGKRDKLVAFSAVPSFVLPPFFLVGKRDKLVAFSAVPSFVLPPFCLVGKRDKLVAFSQ